jgi:cellulose synthase/poly-beta-1,6-N-acetylglucosamine synthase-like glycosyltransferase
MAADLLLGLIAIPVLCLTGYLFVLTLFARRSPTPAHAPARLFFDIIVPAHNEEAGVGTTVKSLFAIDYPKSLFRVLVVADNCTDQTAARAEAAGATVLVRTDLTRRGKGYALRFAMEESLRDGRANAVAVVDADTIVSSNLLRAFAARIEQGAGAVQANYTVQNPDASWRTRLVRIALGMFHILRSLARERLGVSSGLRGNGMCFTAALLREVPHDAFSLAEDLEYGIRLGEAGHRVHYAPEAHVYGEMVSSGKAARSQRLRWELGRGALAKLHAPGLLRRALQRRDPLLFDLAMDLMVPPLSSLFALTVLGLVASVALSWWSKTLGVSVVTWGLCALFLGFYILRGWALSSTGARGLIDLVWAPAYMIWKLTLPFGRSENEEDEWLRTTREEKHG